MVILDRGPQHECMVTVVRVLVVTVALVLAATLIGATRTRAVAGRGPSSRAEYVDALTPVVEAEFRDDGLDAPPATYGCVAEGYVDGFTLRRLRAVGSPDVVARERSRRHFDFALFRVTRAQEARIVASSILGCLPVSQVLALGFETRAVELSPTSRACLDERFTADPAAAAVYGRNAVRLFLGKAPLLTDAMVRAGTILSECLTPEEQRAVSASA